MEESLQPLGLTNGQVEAYLYLLEHGPTAPPLLAEQLHVTRTNAYKLLDRLVELGLAGRRDVGKKLTYAAEDPIALTSLLAAERNRLLTMERDVRHSMQQLRSKYRQQVAAAEVKTYSGKAKLKQLYEQQAALEQPVYFIASRADIPTMGFDTMNYVRYLPKQHGQQRFGIVTDTVSGPINPAIDERTNLTRTWIEAGEYDAPVEWSVAGDEVTLFVFEKHGSAIRIRHAAVAEAFRQLWHIMNRHLRADPAYATLPHKARRNV